VIKMGILDEEIKSFLMENSADMQKVLIQEVRDSYITKEGNKIAWRQEFKIRMREIIEAEEETKKTLFKEFHSLLADFYDEELERNELNETRNVSRIVRILKEKLEKMEKNEHN